MGLCSNAQCIQLNTQTSYTYDDFTKQSEIDLGSKDADVVFIATFLASAVAGYQSKKKKKKFRPSRPHG